MHGGDDAADAAVVFRRLPRTRAFSSSGSHHDIPSLYFDDVHRHAAVA